ncbi:MAG: four helix bundle protein [Chloroflexota bacterium]
MAKYEYRGKNTAMFQRLPGYKNIAAWQAASDLSAMVNQLTRRLGPGYYKLADQMRTAAVSVHGNIAEGYCSGTLPNYIRYCHLAHGSLGELGSYFQDCERDGLTAGDELAALTKQYCTSLFLLERLLQALIQKDQTGDWDKSYSFREDRVPYLTDTDTNPDLPE